VVGDFSGEEIAGEVEDLEVGEVEKRRRNVAGEAVVVKVNGTQEEALGEGGRDGGVEIVGVEAEFAELEEIGKGRSYFTGELETGKTEVVNSVVVADNAAPVAGCGGRGRVPTVEGTQRVMEVALECG